MALCLFAAACSGRSDPPQARGSGSAKVAAPVPAVAAGHVEPGVPVGNAAWSSDGLRVVYPVQPRDGEHGANQPAYLIAEPRTGESMLLERVRNLLFGRDRLHVVVTSGHTIAIHNLATGAIDAGPFPIAGDPALTAEGRLLWAEPTGATYKVHLRELSRDRDKPLLSLPVAPASPDHPGEPSISFGFDDNGHVVAATPNALRAWFDDYPEAVITIDGPVADLQVSRIGLAYARRDAADRQTFVYIPLADLDNRHPTAIALHADPVCGAGAMQPGTRSEQCSPTRYLLRAPHALCVWDSLTGKLQTQLPVRDDAHCTDDVVWTAAPAGGTGTFFSALTGKPIAKPATLITEPPSKVDPVELALASGKTTAYRSPRKDHLAGVDGDRASLWSPDQKLTWQAAAPSDAVALAFSRGELVVGGAHGQLWRVDLAGRKLSTAALPGCALSTADPLLVAPDGKIAAPCVHDSQRTLVLEGAAAPIYAGGGPGGNVTGATGAASSAIAWDAADGVHAWSFPGGTQRFTFAQPKAHALAITADGTRYAMAGDAAISIRDATNHEVSAIHVASAPVALAFSPDGARLAVQLGDAHAAPITIYDATSGAVVDELPATGAFAWDPTSKRIAGARADGVVIRDVASRRDLETRKLPTPANGAIRAIAWSPDGSRLAALADQRVTLWEAGGASTLLFGGAGAVELRADGKAALLGEPAAARALLDCQIGPRRYPIARCESQLVAPR